MEASSRDQLQHFLVEHQVRRKGGAFTHLGMGETMGKYFINDDDSTTFMQLYSDVLNHEQNEGLCIIERHRACGPVVIDLDVTYKILKTGTGFRFFDDVFISQFVSVLADMVSSMVDIDDTSHMTLTYVLRKPGPPSFNEDTAQYKDGLHIVMSNIVTHANVQFLLREKMLSTVKRFIDAIPEDVVHVVSKVEDIYDKSVIQQNGWMMHGSSKPGKPAYQLYQLWNFPAGVLKKMNNHEKHQYGSDYQLLHSMSVRRHHPGDLSILTATCETDLKRIQKQEEERIQKQKYEGISPSYFQDLGYVKGLVELLSPERADSYEPWSRLGFCLHNIDHRLLATWIEFSMSSTKYTQKEAVASCERMWASMQYGGLGLGSLVVWAQQDNLANNKFTEYRQQTMEFAIVECCQKFMFEKVSEAPDSDKDSKKKVVKLVTATWPSINYYVVKVLYQRYHHHLVCSSPTSKPAIWWEFIQHRWKPCALGIKKFLDEDAHFLFSNSAQKFHRYYLDAVSKLVSEPNSPELLKKKEKSHMLEQSCRKLAENMRHSTNKITITKDAAERFYWQDCSHPSIEHKNNFEEILDSNTHIIGLENGVFDLKEMKFRDGMAEDYVNMTTKNNWDPNFSWDHEHIRGIQTFITQVLPEDDVREYVLLLFASFCDGDPEEKFHIFIGSGGNGKSKLIDLLLNALGEYCGNLPVTALTGARPQSSQASPEIVRLKGKRFVSVQEPSNNEALQPGQLKELTGGDTIYARALHKEPIEFKPQFNMVLASNIYPDVPSDDGGLWRRMVVVRFKSRFLEHPDPEESSQFKMDTTLKAKLEVWGPAFFWMLMQYYKKLHQEHGGRIPVPMAITQETENYRMLNDHISKFCGEKVVVDKGPSASSKFLLLNDMWPAYVIWSKLQGHMLLNRTTLKNWFVKNHYDTKTKELGEGWTGMTLR